MKVFDLKDFFRFYGLIILLLCYFVLHGFIINAEIVSISDALLLFASLLVVSVVVQKISRFIFKDSLKALIATVFIMGWLLFFGVFQDGFSKYRPLAPISRISVFLPLTGCLLIIILVWVAKSKSRFIRLRQFLTVLFIIYILLDLGTAAFSRTSGKQQYVSIPDSAYHSKPDVYLVILDEYLGNEGLQSHFGYSNHRFLSYLDSEKFHVVRNPKSNYNLTIFSVGSMFNMEIPQGIGQPVIFNHFAYKSALNLIEHNRAGRIFMEMGYKLRNKSPFYLPGLLPGYTSGLLPQKLGLMQHQTAYYRVASALPDFLAEQFNFDYFKQRQRLRTGDNNEKMMYEVTQEAMEGSTFPRFTYLHLMMPHAPLLRDSVGNFLPDAENHFSDNESRENAYLQYLVYTNNRVMQLISELKTATQGEAIIILLSDHGLRAAAGRAPEIQFNPLHAVYLPDGNYKGWYDGMSNVNALTTLFREYFKLDIPIQQDSVVIAK